MNTEIMDAFTGLCEAAKGKKNRDLLEFFYRPEDMDEFEVSSFQDFLKRYEVTFHKVLELGDGDLVRVFYSYIPEGSTDPVSTDYTWFPFRKTQENGTWKETGKGTYLKYLAELKGWRKIEGEKISHYFDYSIKKSMDAIHAECAQVEYVKLLEYWGEKGPDVPIDYFVFDDEKSLPELGLEASASGYDWVFSNHPCDLFQLATQALRGWNSRVPRFFLFGFSAYYAQFVAEGRYPVFNISRQEFSEQVHRILEGLPPEKITRLASNIDFDRWAQYVAFFAVISRMGAHPHTIMLLISSSFVTFLFESDAIGSSPADRKEKILKVLKEGTTENFEDTFKKVVGIKLKKADKLWRKALRKGTVCGR